MDYYNRISYDCYAKCRKLKILFWCLAGVLGAAVIVTALLQMTTVACILFLLSIPCVFAGNYQRYKGNIWLARIEKCPKCKSTNVKAHIDENETDRNKKITGFTCKDCGHKWDNSNLLRRLESISKK